MKRLDEAKVRRVLVWGFFVFVFVAGLVAVLMPELRTQIRALVIKEQRTILSAVQSTPLSAERTVTVLKVKNNNLLTLEIYSPESDGRSTLLQRIVLSDSKDGFFNYKGEPTNLVLDDIDGNGTPEILAPSFDADLIAHLNIFRFNEASGLFERLAQ